MRKLKQYRSVTLTAIDKGYYRITFGSHGEMVCDNALNALRFFNEEVLKII